MTADHDHSLSNFWKHEPLNALSKELLQVCFDFGRCHYDVLSFLYTVGSFYIFWHIHFIAFYFFH